MPPPGLQILTNFVLETNRVRVSSHRHSYMWILCTTSFPDCDLGRYHRSFAFPYTWKYIKTLKNMKNCLCWTWKYIYFTSRTLPGPGFIAIGARQGFLCISLILWKCTKYTEIGLCTNLKFYKNSLYRHRVWPIRSHTCLKRRPCPFGFSNSEMPTCDPLMRYPPLRYILTYTWKTLQTWENWPLVELKYYVIECYIPVGSGYHIGNMYVQKAWTFESADSDMLMRCDRNRISQDIKVPTSL